MEKLSIIKQEIHPKAIEICRILQSHGHQAYVVGGCVRDLYLGITPKDWDITTSATPEEVMRLFEHTIPTGLQHGTITVCMDEGFENHFEVTTFRVEGKYQDGRHPEEVKFVNNLTEDLARRDLTINAMAYDPIKKEILDPFNGMQDIENKIIRAVGNPAARFREDGLRIMRAARFAARFDYIVDTQTLAGMVTSIDTLKKVSKERISDELCKILMSSHPSYGLSVLQMCGALDIACPTLTERMLPKMELQDRCQGDLETRLAFLYNKLPVLLVEQELTNLKLSNKEVKRVIFLIKSYNSFISFQQNDNIVSYRKFIARFKNESPDLSEVGGWGYTLQQFISFAGALGLPVTELLGKYRTTVYARRDLAINGDDLMAAGVRPGPNLKILLDNCYQEILEHPEHNNKDYLLQMIMEL